MRNLQLYIRIAIVATMFLVAIVLYPSLPESIPTHWNFEGQADAWGPKAYGVIFGPVIALVLLILFPVLSKIDPKKENYEKFSGSWETLQTAVTLFLAYIFGLHMYFTLYPDSSYLMGQLIMAGVGVLLIVIGVLLGKIKQNYFIGYRTPWALNDPKVWEKTQELAGWTMALAGVVFVVEALIWTFVIPVFLVTVVSVVLVPAVYSYVISRK